MKDKIVIGTRGSKLALWQAEWVKSQIEAQNPSLKVELLKIKTTGDKILDVPLAQVGGKGLFVKEIEESLLRGESDLAVHSMKDMPTMLPDGLHIGAILIREDPRDAFITKDGKGSLKGLPEGANVGTSSLRRSCQLLSEGQFDAIILAAAGVRRLGFEERITETLDTTLSLPAIAQGAVGIECRAGDEFINSLIGPLNHAETATCVGAERALLKRLEGGCQVPIAAHAVLNDGSLTIEGLVGSVSGDTIIRDRREGSPEEAEALGVALAEELLSRGADKILAEVYGAEPTVNGDISS
jgi:hydroxymethylbilane synthase